MMDRLKEVPKDTEFTEEALEFFHYLCLRDYRRSQAAEQGEEKETPFPFSM